MVEVRTDYRHVHQIFAGYALLQMEGRLQVEFKVIEKLSDAHPERSIVRVWVDGRPICYDVADDYYLSENRTEQLLSNVERYYKRSYRHEVHGGWRFSERMRPLGFNYDVIVPHPVFHSYHPRPDRALFRHLVKRVSGRERPPVLSRLEQAPVEGSPSLGVFLTRLWNPDDEQTDARKGEVERLNDLRISMVLQLRQALGPRVLAGLEPTSYALTRVPELVLGRKYTSKSGYLQALRNASVGITTRGLGASNGWKLGEYVAFSKAIVAESLFYEVPGGFADGANLTEFGDVEGAVRAAADLLSDRDRRIEMQRANWAYYINWLRPDVLIQRTLDDLFAADGGAF